MKNKSNLADNLPNSYDIDMSTFNENYYNPSITIDVVLFTIENSVLKTLTVVRQKPPFKGATALPGGFLKKGETTEMTVKRILKEKAGVEGIYTEQLYTFDDPERDPRGEVISVTYFAAVSRNKIIIDESRTTEHPRFLPVNKLPKLAFDHKKIITYAIERLCSKLEYTNMAYSLLPNLFTLTELQNIYEAVFDKSFDKRNFRKKFLLLDVIEDSKQVSTGGKQRPARFYKFKKKKLEQLKKFF